MKRSLLAVLVFAAPAYADAPRGCLAPVTAAITRAFPKAAITACKAEREHGRDQFEVKLTAADGKNLEVDVAPDGAILQVEEPIAVAALPDAVKRAFAAKYPRATAEAAEKQTAGKSIRYEIAFRTDKGHDKGRKEATFAADGSFVEDE